jgi:hypothetical protein
MALRCPSRDIRSANGSKLVLIQQEGLVPVPPDTPENVLEKGISPSWMVFMVGDLDQPDGLDLSAQQVSGSRQ